MPRGTAVSRGISPPPRNAAQKATRTPPAAMARKRGSRGWMSSATVSPNKANRAPKRADKRHKAQTLGQTRTARHQRQRKRGGQLRLSLREGINQPPHSGQWAKSFPLGRLESGPSKARSFHRRIYSPTAFLKRKSFPIQVLLIYLTPAENVVPGVGNLRSRSVDASSNGSSQRILGLRAVRFPFVVALDFEAKRLPEL